MIKEIENIFSTSKVTKYISHFSIALFMLALTMLNNMALAMPTNALNQDYLENELNIVVTPNDFTPIIWHDIANYDFTQDGSITTSCLGPPKRCSDLAIESESTSYKYYETQKQGLIILYFDRSTQLIGYGLDYDRDGIGDLQDNDIDGDGVNNDTDDFPNDASEWTDTDGDGVGDNKDAFPNNPNETKDSDADGVGDNSDAFPHDANETTDSNGNGIGDNFEAVPTDLTHQIRDPLKGNFKVDENGAASYSIAMDLPPGINNIEPTLEFVYNSAQKRGAMRMGWSLSGLSAISLCKATRARDGFIQGVEFSSTERQRFCLDGQPLILVPGGSNDVYGQAGTEYVTEVRSDLKIKAIGQTGTGPEHFAVKSGDGKTTLYGSVAKSRQRNGCCEFGFGSKVSSISKDEIIIWKMDSVTDRQGNSVNYEYHTRHLSSNDNVYSYLSKIRYQGNALGVNSEIEIDFNWSEGLTYNEWETFTPHNSTTLINRFRSYKEGYGSRAIDGFILFERHKLDKVSISVGGNALRNYQIDYASKKVKGQPPIHNVKSIQECTYGNCTLPIRFAWDEQYQGMPATSQCTKDSDYFAGGEPNFSTTYKTSVPYSNNFGWGGGNYYSQILGDYNNDDLIDVAVVYTYKENNNSRMTVHVAYSKGDGTFESGGTPYSEIIGGSILNHRLSGDLNNDGYADLIATNSSASGWRVYTVLNNGDGSFAAPRYQKVSTGNFIDDESYQKVTGDFNGDGHLDIMAIGAGMGSDKNDKLLSRVSGFVAYVALGKGDGTFATAKGGRLATAFEIAKSLATNRSLFTGDFNGDGITDIATTYFANDRDKFGDPYQGAEIIVALGTESGIFNKPSIQRWSHHEFPTWWEPSANKEHGPVQTADINGDGLTDFVAIGNIDYFRKIISVDSQFGTVTQNPDYLRRTIVSMLSNGDGTFTKKIYEDILPKGLLPAWQALPCEGTHHYPTIADFNGDGYSDISFGSRDFLLGRGNGRFLKQGGRFIAGDNVKPTGGGLSIGSFGIGDTTYGTYAFDVNRDGNPDVVEVVVDKNGLKVGSNAYAENLNQQTISNIIDGYGRQIDIKYEAIAKNKAYTKGSGATYPYRDIGSGRTVVSRVSISDGLGGRYHLDYQYSGLLADLERQELLGFATMSVTDSREQTKTTNTYAQTFPLNNRLLKQETHLSDNTLVKKTETVWRFNKVQNQIGTYDHAWYTLIKDTETSTTLNDDGKLIGTVSQVYVNHDIYGRPSNTTTTKSDGYASVIDRVIDNSETWEDYYVGRVHSSSETKTGPDFAASITRSKAYTYYPDGLLAFEIIEPNNADLYLRTDYRYDDYGRVISTTVAGHAGAQYIVAARAESKIINMPTLVPGLRPDNVSAYEMEVITTNAENHVSKEYIDVRFGHTTRVIDANDLQTFRVYDIYGDLLQEIRPNNTLTTYTRDLCNVHCPENAVYRLFLQSTGESFNESYFDINDRELRNRSIGLNGQMIYQDTRYDSLGRKTYASQPYFSPGNARLYSAITYDALGRIKIITTPEEGRVDFLYQSLMGLGTKVTKIQSRSGLDGVWTLITEQYRNLLDQSVQITDAKSDATFFKFDAFANLKTTIDPYANEIKVDYDTLGRAVLLSDPDLGQRTFGVDAFGQIRFKKDAKNQQVSLSYDRLGRLVKRTKSEGTDTWVYDNSPNAIGKLVSETAASGSRKTLTYDIFSRIEKETHVIGNVHYVMQNAYDFAGRLNKVTYPTGFSVTYDYHRSSGYLESVYNGNTVYWRATALNAKGERLIETFANGLSTTTHYNVNSGRIETIKTGLNNAAVQNLRFVFDSIGNLNERADLKRSLVERFVYDDVNRLDNVYLNNQFSKKYNYDDIGNILAKSDYATDYRYGQNNAGPHAVTQIRNLNNQLVSFAYDDNGNMVSGAGRIITYTSFDKPFNLSRQGKTTRFEYDANQNRVRQMKGSDITTYINPRWDTGVHYEKEQSATEIKHKHFINAGNIPIAIYTTIENSSKTELRFLHKDHLGSVTTITAENGSIVEDLSYQAFGDRRNSDWSDATTPLSSETSHHGFTGHEHLDDLGLIHMNARLYDPKLGRFMTADTVIPTKDNLEAFNRYTYVYNNPLSLTDPSGNSPAGGAGRMGGMAPRMQANLNISAASNQNYNEPVHNSAIAGISNSKSSGNSLFDIARGAANIFIDTLNGVFAAEAARFDSVYESRGLENPMVPLKQERFAYNNESFGEAGEIGMSIALAIGTGGSIALAKGVKGIITEKSSEEMIRNVNRFGDVIDNCGSCVIAADATLAGYSASAVISGITYTDKLEKYAGRKFGGSIIGRYDLEAQMLKSGNNARGIVLGSRGSQVGHFFNVINQRGQIRFLDAQQASGKADLKGFTDFNLLRTN